LRSVKIVHNIAGCPDNENVKYADDLQGYWSLSPIRLLEFYDKVMNVLFGFINEQQTREM
jgi:hypothetical protein